MRARVSIIASWGLLALAAGPLWAASRLDDDAAPPPPPEVNLPEPARAAPAGSSRPLASPSSPAAPVPVPDNDLANMRDWTLGQTREALFTANETLALAKREHAAVMAAIAAGAIPPAPAAAAVTASSQAAPVQAPPTKAAPVKALPAPPVNPPAAAVTAPQPQTVTLQLAPQPAPQPQTITLQLVAAPAAAVAAPVVSPAPVPVAPLEAKIRHAGPIRKGLAGIGNALSTLDHDRIVIRQPKARATATVVPVQYTVSAPSVASVPAPTAAVVAPAVAPVTATPQSSSAGATVLGGNFWTNWLHR